MAHPFQANRYQSIACIIAILLIAATLRMIWPMRAPVGLQVDEASNVWNAWCLANNGLDEHGVPWPIFTTAEFGSHRSPLFLYFIIPFQSLFGFNLWSARLASATTGTAAVGLIYSLGRRWFDESVGLLAAALMAIDPWHLQLARWGHEASLCPMLALIAIVATRSAAMRRWPWFGFVAGLVAGGACYGYSAIRLFLPVYAIAAAIVIGRARCRDWLRLPQSPRTLFYYLFGLALTFGPLAYQHLTNPDINRRARDIVVWEPTDSLSTRVLKVAARYGPHFDPISLSFRSPQEPSQATPRGFGPLNWYIAPLCIIGLIALARRWRIHLPSRLLLAAFLVYPAADLISIHPGVNTLRSSPGIWAILLVAAVGLCEIVRWFELACRRFPALPDQYLRAATYALLSISILVPAAIYLERLFFQLDHTAAQFEVHNVNILQACDWLKPRFDEFDGVVWTETRFNYLYPVTAVALQYSPRKWFDEPIERFFSTGPKYKNADLVLRYGKQYFLYTPREPVDAIEDFAKDHPVHRLAVIARPQDVKDQRFADQPPTVLIKDPQGQVSLLIFDVTVK